MADPGDPAAALVVRREGLRFSRRHRARRPEAAFGSVRDASGFAPPAGGPETKGLALAHLTGATPLTGRA